MRPDPSNTSDPVGETQETYDLIAAEWERQNAVPWPDLTDHLGVMTASLPPGGVVADVGCGPGRDVALLRTQGFRVIGIDLSLGQLRANGLPGVVQADMLQLPLRAGSADAIWCQAALLHIPRTAVPAVLAEFARAVRTGGEVYLCVLEGDGEGFEVASKYRSDRRRWFTLHREPDLVALLTAAGFAVHQMRRNRHGPVWLSIHARRIGQHEIDLRRLPCASSLAEGQTEGQSRRQTEYVGEP
jgi:SAM-dependent methyltransferase